MIKERERAREKEQSIQCIQLHTICLHTDLLHYLAHTITHTHKYEVTTADAIYSHRICRFYPDATTTTAKMNV